jgi:ACS family tartrate transporter-like MFS transporter
MRIALGFGSGNTMASVAELSLRHSDSPKSRPRLLRELMTTMPAVAQSEIEARTIRKVRMRIIPFVFILFVIAYIDRINIGFAALTMNRDLAVTSQQYGFLAGIFFLGYFVFEIPSNLLLHKIGARVWIARILVSWGILAILTGFVQTAFHLYVLRFLLGVAEAGFFPGILLYLTYWFRQKQLAHAAALLIAATPVASIVGAPFSGVILDRIHWLGVSSWRWLLILEGVPAVAGGIFTYFLLTDRPAEAQFLTTDEKRWIMEELAREQQQKLNAKRITVGQALMHGRVWHLTAAYFVAMVTNYSMIFWMPQHMKALSTQYSNSTVGMLVMTPYVVGLIAMILVARSSDRRLERRYHAAIPATIAAMSLVSLGATATTSVFISVLLWCLVAFGIYSLYGPFWSLPNEFLTGFSAAAGIALINSFGNLGGFVGPYAIGAINKQTGSFRGGLEFAGVSLFISAMLILALRKRTEQQVTATESASE